MSSQQNTQFNIAWEGTPWRDRSLSYPTRTVRLATTFSGIGAVEYALRRMGVRTEIVFAGDINPNCKRTYFANYAITEERWHNDVHNLDARPWRQGVDLLVGGAPCQAFSIVGEQRGFDDTRGTLFREFARVVKECQPKVFIFENVQGLLKHDQGRTWQVMYRTFRDYCGYDIHYQLLNARDYGIPQTRERLYCVGFREETEFRYPAPVPLRYRMYDFLEDYADSRFTTADKSRKVLAADERRREALADGDAAEGCCEFVFPVREVADKYYLSEKTARYVLCPGTKNFRTQIKTDLDIARPLLQTMHKMHRAGVDNYVTFNKSKGIGGLRRLTPRECFRLMGFRDDFRIPVSDTAAYMQAGNSIVVDVLIAILRQMDITLYASGNGE